MINRPLYVIDAETVARHHDPLRVVETLVDRIQDPRWKRHKACYGCNNWDTRWGLGNLPTRPGAGSQAIESCSKCWYAMLDELEPEKPTAANHASTELRHMWLSVMGAKRLPNRRKSPRRAVRWEPGPVPRWSGDDSGKVGNRTKKPSSFSSKASSEVSAACPGCSKDLPVERYWSLGRAEEEPVAHQLVRCPECGVRKLGSSS